MNFECEEYCQSWNQITLEHFIVKLNQAYSSWIAGRADINEDILSSIQKFRC